MEPISKKDMKMDKVLRKGRTSKPQNSSAAQNSQNDKINPNNNEATSIIYIDPLTQQIFWQKRLKKAKQWWSYLDCQYFKPIKRKNILLSRDLTSAGKLVNFFSSESQLQSSFVNEQIFQKYPNLRQNTLIHVLFKSSTPLCVQLISFSFVNYIQILCKRANRISKSSNNQIEEQKVFTNCTVSPLNNKYRNDQAIIEYTEQQVQQAMKIGNLQFQSCLKDEKILYKTQKVQEIKQNMRSHQQVDMELHLWQAQAQRQNCQNSILWNKLISTFQEKLQPEISDYTDQTFKINQQLMHHTILRYFEHGTRDKTQEMLKQLLENNKLIKPAKTHESTNKKYFQTDCKICFCSFNYDSNQVLYCDMCNTSFHLACYGMHRVPDVKEYFCDPCTALRKQDKFRKDTKGKKITCQICCKPNFPIKQIDGHFYHMTCLIIMNFIIFKEGRMQLREGLTHQNILKKVIQSQTECSACIFCPSGQGSEVGMQFKCSFQGCTSSMHPICAYINGCKFNVQKLTKEKKLEVNILCNKHDYERDYIQQSYLRRYMCNFKNTSQKPLQQFQAEYQLEIASRKQKLDSRTSLKQQLPKIIIDTKIIRKHISFREQKNQQKNQEIQSTETRRILERLVKQNF